MIRYMPKVNTCLSYLIMKFNGDTNLENVEIFQSIIVQDSFGLQYNLIYFLLRAQL